MPDTQAEMDQVLALLAQMNEAMGDEPTLEMLRGGYQGAGEVMPTAEGVSVEEGTLGGVPGLKLVPERTVGARTLLYFHGGGYVIGSPIGHKPLVSHMAAKMGATAWSMDYRLAPEAPFPAAVEDGLASYRALLDAGTAPDQIIISGDSAGGGLTLATALKIKADGLPLPAGLVPLSPWANLANDGWSHGAMAGRDPMINDDNINMFSATYLAGAAASDPLASPVHGDMTGLPPMLIQVGSEEALLSDSTLLAERAGAAKVDVTLEVWPGMIHVFQFFHGFLSEAGRATDRIAAWADSRWG